MPALNPAAHRECTLEGDSSSLYAAACALIRLQGLYGLIPRLQVCVWGGGVRCACVRVHMRVRLRLKVCVCVMDCLRLSRLTARCAQHSRALPALA